MVGSHSFYVQGVLPYTSLTLPSVLPVLEDFFNVIILLGFGIPRGPESF